MYYVVHTPIQDIHYMQAWPRPVQYREAVQEKKSYRRQRPGNHWHEHKSECH